MRRLGQIGVVAATPLLAGCTGENIESLMGKGFKVKSASSDLILLTNGVDEYSCPARIKSSLTLNSTSLMGGKSSSFALEGVVVRRDGKFVARYQPAKGSKGVSSEDYELVRTLQTKPDVNDFACAKS